MIELTLTESARRELKLISKKSEGLLFRIDFCGMG